MAKQSGIGSSLYVGIYDISGDVGAVGAIENSVGTFDVTAINASAMERIVGRKDGHLAFTGFSNATAGQEYPVLSALPRTDVIATCLIGGTTVGFPAASLTAKQITYGRTVGTDGTLATASELQANGKGLEFGEILTSGKQSFGTGTVSGTSINLGAVSSLFGAAAYLHVFSVASGTATFAVQDSDDDVTFIDVPGLVFTAATGATSERKQTAAGATVRQYIRLQGTGVHGAAVVACNFVRYTEAGPI